jgi:hypothetical protein
VQAKNIDDTRHNENKLNLYSLLLFSFPLVVCHPDLGLYRVDEVSKDDFESGKARIDEVKNIMCQTALLLSPPVVSLTASFRTLVSIM